MVNLDEIVDMRVEDDIANATAEAAERGLLPCCLLVEPVNGRVELLQRAAAAAAAALRVEATNLQWAIHVEQLTKGWNVRRVGALL